MPSIYRVLKAWVFTAFSYRPANVIPAPPSPILHDRQSFARSASHAATGNRVRRAFECGQIDGNQHPVQSETAGFREQDAGTHAAYQLFSVGPADEPVAHLVDLPGYGYAEVPGAAKAHWQQLLSTYLQSRAQLCGMILMMDSRRPLTELDQIMIDWFAPTGKPIHALLTKCDKLTRQEMTNALRATKKSFAEYKAAGYRGELTVQLFSALKRTGIEEAHELIESWLIPEAAGENESQDTAQ
jgi:GTP-binding protein